MWARADVDGDLPKIASNHPEIAGYRVARGVGRYPFSEQINASGTATELRAANVIAPVWFVIPKFDRVDAPFWSFDYHLRRISRIRRGWRRGRRMGHTVARHTGCVVRARRWHRNTLPIYAFGAEDNPAAFRADAIPAVIGMLAGRRARRRHGGGQCHRGRIRNRRSLSNGRGLRGGTRQARGRRDGRRQRLGWGAGGCRTPVVGIDACPVPAHLSSAARIPPE